MKNKNIIKTSLLFLTYLIYPMFESNLTNFLSINSIFSSFFLDVVFLLGIVFIYRKEIKESINELKQFKLSIIIKKIVLWIGIIFLSNMIMGITTELLCPNLSIDDNTNALSSLYEISTYYTIFKTMIFAIIAEELLFRKSVFDLTDNKFIFIIISSVIYALITFIFNGFPVNNFLIYFLMYFIPGIVLALTYIKNNNNIILLMLIKFFYQLIPLTILLLS